MNATPTIPSDRGADPGEAEHLRQQQHRDDQHRDVPARDDQQVREPGRLEVALGRRRRGGSRRPSASPRSSPASRGGRTRSIAPPTTSPGRLRRAHERFGDAPSALERVDPEDRGAPSAGERVKEPLLLGHLEASGRPGRGHRVRPRRWFLTVDPDRLAERGATAAPGDLRTASTACHPIVARTRVLAERARSTSTRGGANSPGATRRVEPRRDRPTRTDQHEPGESDRDRRDERARTRGGQRPRRDGGDRGCVRAGERAERVGPSSPWRRRDGDGDQANSPPTSEHQAGTPRPGRDPPAAGRPRTPPWRPGTCQPPPADGLAGAAASDIHTQDARVGRRPHRDERTSRREPRAGRSGSTATQRRGGTGTPAGARSAGRGPDAPPPPRTSPSWSSHRS